ncbi:hypothetical protein KP509_30G038000 [Ceratopteris richardii]|uniref:RING-type domain-containing protein n=1 Tax=Ceratopteris richardii TaxID=49495 RepID=A0A8T2R1N2_CERRI|nr:hypothetical protein KP509_30G038000 [Ceratopteris richardii]
MPRSSSPNPYSIFDADVDDAWKPLPSSSFHPFFSSPRKKVHKDDIADLEGVCMKEFRLNLGNVRSRMLEHVEAQQSAFDRLCTDLRATTDASGRRRIADNFVRNAASSARDFANETQITCNEMQAYCFSKLSENNEELKKEVKRLEDAAQIRELEQKISEDEMRIAFQGEKAALEASLREELVACQICTRNARNIIILPCLHAQFCQQCLEAHKAQNDSSCPACRGPIRALLPYIA